MPKDRLKQWRYLFILFLVVVAFVAFVALTDLTLILSDWGYAVKNSLILSYDVGRKGKNKYLEKDKKEEAKKYKAYKRNYRTIVP